MELAVIILVILAAPLLRSLLRLLGAFVLLAILLAIANG